MRGLFLLYCILPLFAFSQINQTDTNGLRQGFWKKEYPNGRTMYEGNFTNGKPSGEWKRYYEGGQVKALIHYREDTDPAAVVLFDEWGNKVAEGFYLDEKRSGKWIMYAQNRKIAEEHYVKGLKHGISRRYYSSGEILDETEWSNGIQEGKYQAFFIDGKPYFQCKFQNNKRNGLCVSWFQNGRQEMVANYKDNLRDGEWKYYNEEGKYLYSLFYAEGRLLNPQVRDSIDHLQLLQVEQKKRELTDPEKFMQDPSEYMMKMQIMR